MLDLPETEAEKVKAVCIDPDTGMLARKTVEGQGSGAVQPDMNASEGEPGHILHRTHSVTPNFVYLPETVINFREEEMYPLNAELEAGDIITAIYDGVEYPVTVVSVLGMLAAGNLGGSGVPGCNTDTGEPFCIAVQKVGGTSVCTAIPVDGENGHTLAILGNRYEKLPCRLVETPFEIITVTNYGNGENMETDLTFGDAKRILKSGKIVFCKVATFEVEFNDDYTQSALRSSVNYLTLTSVFYNENPIFLIFGANDSSSTMQPGTDRVMLTLNDLDSPDDNTGYTVDMS